MTESNQSSSAATLAPAHDLIPITKPYLGEEEAQAAAAAIRSGWVAQGPLVASSLQAIWVKDGHWPV